MGKKGVKRKAESPRPERERKRKWESIPGGVEHYIRSGVDELDARVRRVLGGCYGRLEDDVENAIRDLLHERRWIRDAAAKWFMYERTLEAKRKQEEREGEHDSNS